MGGTRKGPERITTPMMAKPRTKPDEREAFAQWLLTPKAEREPATAKAFGEAIGVHEKTLSMWKRDRSFMRSVYQAAAGSLRIEWLGPILDRQRMIATHDGFSASESTSAAKFLVTAMEKAMAMEEAIDDAQRPIETMSLDELRAELGSIVDLIDDKIDLKV